MNTRRFYGKPCRRWFKISARKFEYKHLHISHSLIIFSNYFVSVCAHQVCHSKSGEINPVKVGNLVKAYVDKYKHTRKHKKGEDTGKTLDIQTEAMTISGTP